jgi:hypothetical protein
VARRFLDEAPASAAAPSFSAPVANGVASQFKAIGTETILNAAASATCRAIILH